MEVRFEKIDAMLKDPKSEVNTDCLLVSSRLAALYRQLASQPFGVSLFLGEKFFP